MMSIHLTDPKPDHQGTAILVLGAKLAANGSAGPALRRRCALAVAQDQALGGGGLIIVSGGVTGGPNHPSEAAVMAGLLVEAGIEPGRILREAAARNTIENMVHSLGLLRDLPAAQRPGRLLIVSDHAHLARAGIIARWASQGWPLEITLCGARPSWRSTRILSRMREALSLPYTLARLSGRKPVPPPDAAEAP
ncbi:MAG: YdcF family protein [Rhodospirillaceae bacterium]